MVGLTSRVSDLGWVNGGPNLHFSQVPRWWWWCWYEDITLRISSLKQARFSTTWNPLTQFKIAFVSFLCGASLDYPLSWCTPSCKFINIIYNTESYGLLICLFPSFNYKLLKGREYVAFIFIFLHLAQWRGTWSPFLNWQYSICILDWAIFQI